MNVPTLLSPRGEYQTIHDQAFRFAKEPRRLAKRYFWGNSVFSLEAARTLRRGSSSD